MPTVLAHCYGCDATTPVFPDSMAASLRASGWFARAGKTYCPTCATERGLAPPPRAHVDEDAPEPPSGPAINDPATRASLDRHRRRAWVWLLVGIALLVPSILVARNRSNRADYLLAHGMRTPGTIVSLGDRGRANFVLVQYKAAGVVRVGRINLRPPYRVYGNEDITVIYDPAHPTHIRTPTQSNGLTSITRPLLVGLIFGIAALLGALGVYRRGIRWRSLLGERDWELVRSRCIVPPAGRRQVATLELTRASERDASPFHVQVGGLSWRTKRLVNRANLWFAGGSASGVVLAIPETRDLYSATTVTGG